MQECNRLKPIKNEPLYWEQALTPIPIKMNEKFRIRADTVFYFPFTERV